MYALGSNSSSCIQAVEQLVAALGRTLPKPLALTLHQPAEIRPSIASARGEGAETPPAAGPPRAAGNAGLQHAMLSGSVRAGRHEPDYLISSRHLAPPQPQGELNASQPSRRQALEPTWKPAFRQAIRREYSPHCAALIATIPWPANGHRTGRAQVAWRFKGECQCPLMPKEFL